MASHTACIIGYTARMLLLVGSIRCILRSNPTLLLLNTDYIIWEGFIFPSNCTWYTELLLVFVCIGCIMLSKPTLLFLDLIDIGTTGLSRGHELLNSRSMMPCHWIWYIRLLCLIGSIGCIIVSKPISLLVELMDIWLEGRTVQGAGAHRESCILILLVVKAHTHSLHRQDDWRGGFRKLH
jgi:hypothetical protein